MMCGEVGEPRQNGALAVLGCRPTFPNPPTWTSENLGTIVAEPLHGLVKLGRVIGTVPDLHDAAIPKREVEGICYVVWNAQSRSEVILDGDPATYLIGLV